MSLRKIPQNWNFGQFWPNLLLFCTFMYIGLALTKPFFVGYPNVGLDPSWATVAGEAGNLGLSLGTDLVFTTGPLSSLYHHYFVESQAFLIIAIWLLFCAYLSAALLYLRNRSNNKWISTGLILAVFLVYPFYRDSILFLPCLIFFNIYYLGIRNVGFIAISCALMAAFSLAKFSVFPLSVLTVLLIDILAISQKRLPLSTALFFLFFVFLFVLGGQDISNIIPYLQSSLEVTSGYTPAMSTTGNRQDLLAWIVVTTGFVTILFFDFIQNIKTQEPGNTFSFDKDALVPEAIKTLLYLVILWMALKAGFVRHDLHALIGWSTLVFCIFIYTLVYSRNISSQKYHTATLLALLVISLILGSNLPYKGNNQKNAFTPVTFIGNGWQQVRVGLTLMADPNGWLEKHQAAKEQAFEKIKAEYPLPELTGTVDMIPSSQAEVIANDLEYHPRPTIQEYTTYSSKLIDRNHAFFTSDEAPDYVLFAPGSIDNRHPASAEGSLWPLLISQYEPVDRARYMLVLKKQASSQVEGWSEETLTLEQEYEIGFNENLEIQSSDKPLFIKIDVQPTLFNKLVSLIFKPSILQLTTTYDGEQESRFRLIPDMARAGMVLSPFVKSTQDYLAMVTDGYAIPNYPQQKLTSIQISSEGWGNWMYHPTIGVTVFSLEVPAFQSINTSSLVEHELQKLDNIMLLMETNQFNPPALELAEEGIFAHAPTTLKMPVKGGRFVEVQYGIRKGAWDGANNTDGVCFAAQVPGSDQVLWQHCLTPETNPADRDLQTAQLEIPEGVSEIELITSCLEACNWDWSYWSKAIMVASPSSVEK